MGKSPGYAGSARRGGRRAACPRGYRRGHWASSVRYRTGYPYWSATARPRWPPPSLVPVWGLGLPWAVSFLDRTDTMLVRWFPERAAVGKLLYYHSRAITMEEKVYDQPSALPCAGEHDRRDLVCGF